MCKRLFFLISIILVLGTVDFAFGFARWRNITGNNDFSDPCNWLHPDNLYDVTNKIVINMGPDRDVNAPIMSYTPDPCYTVLQLRGPGFDEGYAAEWYITGGLLHVGSGGWRICYNDNTTGYTEMTGGELVFDGDILCPVGDSNCAATVLLHGGTIEAGGIEFRTGGLFDIAGDGTLVLDGDKTSNVEGWISSGYLTAYDGAGEFTYDFNDTYTGKTTITALGARFRAWNPSPGHLTEDLCPADVNLSWTPGDFAADVNGHDIYFGTSPNDVNESADPCVVGHDSNSWKPPTLELGVTHYWRIDEVNDGNVWVGPVWQFTVEDGKVHDRSPADGYRGLPVDVNLVWAASCLATAHDVYFGTDFNDVNEGINGTFKGSQPVADTNYDPSLETLTNYYWRVDEVRDGNVVRKGDIWSFRTHLGGILMWYSFDGVLNNDIVPPVSAYTESGKTIEFEKYTADGGSVKYGASNPTYNTSGTSADFEPDAGLYRLDPCDPNDPNPDILRLDGSQYTIEMWLYVDAGDYDSTNMILVGKTDREPWSIMLSDLGQDNDLRWYHDGGRINADGEMEDKLEEWIHVAAVFDQSLSSRNQKLYVNGDVVEYEGDDDLNPTDNNEPVGIGVDVNSDGNLGDFFDGKIDELRILDLALRPSQFLYPFATDPSPDDGKQGIDPNDANDPNVLSWAPWEPADFHDVYFGTDYDSVRDAAVGNDPNNVYKGRFDSLTYPNDGNALPLELSTIYFWRIDEVEGSDVYTGHVWTFRTEFVIIDPNLLLWYPFDEGEGEWVYDNSGHTLHSYDSSINADNWDTDGKSGYCLHFKNDVGLPVDERVLEEVTDEITVAMWLYGQTQDGALDNWVLQAGADGNYVQVMVPDENGNVHWRAGNDSNDLLVWELESGTASAWIGNWHHLAFVKDESEEKMYIYFDGEQAAWKPDTISSLANVVNKPFKIGAKISRNSDYEGKIDDFMVYKIAMSESQIAGLFRGGDVDIAWSPSPYDGQPDAPYDANLVWKPGDHAAQHEVFFGTSWADVNSMTDACSVQDACEYDPCDLELDTYYYWRIDEVNDSNKWPGPVWSFKTAEYIVVDDFETYNKTTKQIKDMWRDYWWQAANPPATGGLLDLGVYPYNVVHTGGSQSMMCQYKNKLWPEGYASVCYSDVWLPIPVEDRNWTAGGVRLLRLYFYGDADNDTNDTERMFVGLKDNTGDYAEVRYSVYDPNNEDMNDFKIEEWQEWNIGLPHFNDSNYASIVNDVDLTNVVELHIGFGNRDNPQCGGEGVVIFDDIRLHLPYCVPALAPVADFSGDCIVNLADVGYIADDWLRHDVNFGSAIQEPNDANLVGWWKLDDGVGNTAVDSSVYDHNGTIEGDYSWVTGHNDVNLADLAVQFGEDGGRVLVADTNELRPKYQVSVSAWVYFTRSQDDARVVVKGKNDEETYELEIDDTNHFIFQCRDANGNRYNVGGSGNVWPDDWIHLAGTIDGDTNTLKCYVNGELDDSRDDANFVERGFTLSQDPNNGLAIGNRSDGTNKAFRGTVDDVRVYNYALSEAEVAWLASDGTGYVPLTAPTNLYDKEKAGEQVINFKDFAMLLEDWLEEILYP